jgi:uncharacterized membrane protein YfcA
MRHPDEPTRPIIYYDAALIFFPLQLAGANIGVILSYILPKTILLIAAVGVLLFALTLSINKAYTLSSKESQNEDLPAPQTREESTYLLAKPREGVAETNENGSQVDEVNSSEPNDIEMTLPWQYIFVILGVWGMYALVYVSMELVPFCSWEFYVLLVIIYPFIVAQVKWSYMQLIENQKVQDDEGNSEDSVGRANDGYSVTVLEGDILWDQMSLVPMILSVLIGCLSVMLGIGGGELMGPLLLSLNVRAEIIAASIPFMMILSTSSSLVHYMTLGGVPYAYGVWMSVLGFFGGFIGRNLSLWFVRQTKRPSIILICFSFVLLISFGIYVYYLYLDSDSLDFSFTWFC